MRVFVFGTRGFPNVQGGVEKHCEYLYGAIGAPYKITVFRRKPYVDKSINAAIDFIDLPSTKIKGFEALFHSFLCTICCIVKRPDIIHVHNIGPGLFIPFLRLFGLKVVLTYHSPNYEHSKWNQFSRLLLRGSELVALSFSNKIIFVNRYQMGKQKSKVKKKSYYIPNGISPIKAVADMDVLKRYNLKQNNYILGVGRITPEKGFLDLINAYKKTNLKDCNLVIVGGVEHEQEYFNRLKNESNDSIIFTGILSSDQLAQLYQNAKLFVLSSYNEGFPLVVLEAMQYGCSILLSDIPATRLLNLSDDIYFPVGNVDVLSNKIDNKMLHDYQKYNFDLCDYDWLKIAKQTTDVYHLL